MNRHSWISAILGLLCLVCTPALAAAETTPAPAEAVRDVQALADRIDQLIAARWAGKDVQPAARADDAEFFRRVHLDLAGRIPSIVSIRDFLDDDRPDKRRIWVEELLKQGSYSNHFTNVWRSLLLAQTNQQAQFQVPALDQWLHQRLKANMAYDQMVRELLTGATNANFGTASTAAYFQANENKAENLAASTSRLFLGVKLECAQCHNHPFDKWTRMQFWEYAAFFANANQGRQEIAVPGTDKVVPARFLDGTEPQWQAGVNARTTLAQWLTAADNPFFARAAVNRTWAYFFGMGLVDQADGPGDQDPASHSELLDELARAFVAHRFDMKFLIQAITASQAYQRSSAGTHPSQQDPRLFARMALRGMTPAQLFDSLAEATEYEEAAGSGTFPFAQGPQSPRNEFLAKFAAQDQRTEHQTSILQALYLMNNKFVVDRTSLQHNKSLNTIATAARSDTARRVETLFLLALSRKPRPEESARLIRYVDSGGPTGDPRLALTDVFWALLNSPEFILNH